MNEKTTLTATGKINYFISGDGGFTTRNGTTFGIQAKKGISPKLYFKYVKSKFGLLGGMKLNARIKKLWKLAEECEKFGQIALSDKYLKIILKETKESEMYAFGYKIFIEEKFLEKFRHNTRNCSISITPLKNYTKLIPKDVKEKVRKANSKKVFDNFVVVHYDPDKKAVNKTEEEERKDPIIFGKIDESDRYYFIADWEDEYCDLTLEDIVDKLNLDEEEITLTKNIK